MFFRCKQRGSPILNALAILILSANFGCSENRTSVIHEVPQPAVFKMADEHSLVVMSQSDFDRLNLSDRFPNRVIVQAELLGSGQYRTVQFTLTPDKPCDGFWEVWTSTNENGETNPWLYMLPYPWNGDGIWEMKNVDTRLQYTFEVRCSVKITNDPLISSARLRLKTIVADFSSLR